MTGREGRLSWEATAEEVRLNEVVTLKCPYFTLIIGAMASEYIDRPSKVLAFKCFGLILKNKMATIANNLKIIKML